MRDSAPERVCIATLLLTSVERSLTSVEGLLTSVEGPFTSVKSLPASVESQLLLPKCLPERLCTFGTGWRREG
jgi:hypothetical protein